MDSLTNQEFLYRQTPVAYDGTGTLTSIKGNTVKFNQYIDKNYRSTTTVSSVAFTNNGDGSWTINGTASADIFFILRNNVATDYFGVGHYFYFKPSVTNDDSSVSFWILKPDGNSLYNGRISSSAIFQAVDGIRSFFIYVPSGTKVTNLKAYLNLFDLTLMGIDNLTTTAEVEQWLSTHIGNLPYYDYTTGKLISFNGTGLKTTGKNLCDDSTIEIGWYDGVGNYNPDNTQRTSALIPVMPNTTYIATLFDKSKVEIGRLVYTEWDGDGNPLGQSTSATITTSSATAYLRIRNYSDQAPYITSDDFLYQLEYGSTATAFEPYTSNTLSLPISTYFPTGMKDCSVISQVYDELNLATQKAYTKVGRIDLGSLTWSYQSSNKRFVSSTEVSDAKPNGGNNVVGNMVSPIYSATTPNGSVDANQDFVVCFGTTDTLIRIRNSKYTDANAFKTAMSNQYLYFELNNYSEIDIADDLTYPIWNGGTEQILPINDSTPDTAPILCDIDYRGLIPVNATVDPTGSGTVSGTGNYRYHSEATLTATPSDEIYRFLRWEDENGNTLTTEATYSFEVGD